MRIVILTREFPPEGENYGMARLYYRLAKYLSDRDHEVHVVTQAYKRSYLWRDGNILVHRIAPVSKEFQRGSILGRIRFQILATLYLHRLIKKYNIDVIDSQYFFAESFPYVLFKSRPIVLHYIASSIQHIKAYSFFSLLELAKLSLSHMLETFCSFFADVIIANSNFSRRELQQSFVMRLLTTRIVEVMENRLDTSLFIPGSKVEARTKLGLPQNMKIVLFVNRLTPRKGVMTLLEAMKIIANMINNCLLVVVGEDTWVSSRGKLFSEIIKEYCIRNQINVLIKGYVSRERLAYFYQACDVFVQPSLHETFGWPALEAMSVGRPVIVTKTGIFFELEDLPKGISVVPPGDAKALASALNQMLGSDLSRGANSIREYCIHLVSTARYEESVERLYAHLSKKRHKPADFISTGQAT
ncbi:MAG: glycosyltransferase family 4 protein [Conexivisphaerales archaeon]